MGNLFQLNMAESLKNISFLFSGIIACLWFWGVLLYATGFLLNFYVPKSIDSGDINPIAYSFAVNLFLIFIFGAQHSIMARKSIKKLIIKIIPEYFERSFYVLVANLTLTSVLIFFQPITIPIWAVNNFVLKICIYILFALGCFILIYSLLILNHFDFIGLRQIYLHIKKREYAPIEFKTPTIYKYTRHPIYLGTLIVFWATPDMTLGHLILAIGMTIYTLIGIKFEEEDLKNLYGEDYRKYSQLVGMLFPKIHSK